MNQKPANFQRDLEFSRQYENALRQALGGDEPTDASHDLRVNGLKIEVKADKLMHRTSNLFLERWSNAQDEVPGGPWRSVKDGIDYMIYLCSATGRCLVFRPDDLIAGSNVWRHMSRLRPVGRRSPTQRFTSAGWPVPIDQVEKVAVATFTLNLPASTVDSIPAIFQPAA